MRRKGKEENEARLWREPGRAAAASPGGAAALFHFSSTKKGKKEKMQTFFQTS
jgi:hypothetical protein